MKRRENTNDANDKSEAMIDDQRIYLQHAWRRRFSIFRFSRELFNG